MDCYLVYVCTGEYESFHQKPFKAFINRDKAESYAQSLRSRLDDMGYHARGNRSSLKKEESKYDGEIDGFEILSNGAWVSIDQPIPIEM